MGNVPKAVLGEGGGHLGPKTGSSSTKLEKVLAFPLQIIFRPLLLLPFLSMLRSRGVQSPKMDNLDGFPLSFLDYMLAVFWESLGLRKQQLYVGRVVETTFHPTWN